MFARIVEGSCPSQNAISSHLIPWTTLLILWITLPTRWIT